MGLYLALPTNQKDSAVSDLVFSILCEGGEKTLTQLHREVRKRGKSVSFQAVLKAVRLLAQRGVVVKHDATYAISKPWSAEMKRFFDQLYRDTHKLARPKTTVALGKTTTVYTVGNLLELDRLWNDLLTAWLKDAGNDRRNVWRGQHCWWLLPRLQEEDLLHDLFAQHRIKTYNVVTSKTALDRWAIAYYQKKHEHAMIAGGAGDDVAAFGDSVLTFSIPADVRRAIDVLFTGAKAIAAVDLERAMTLFKKPCVIELTVLRDVTVADSVKRTVISQF